MNEIEEKNKSKEDNKKNSNQCQMTIFLFLKHKIMSNNEIRN